MLLTISTSSETALHTAPAIVLEWRMIKRNFLTIRRRSWFMLQIIRPYIDTSTDKVIFYTYIWIGWMAKTKIHIFCSRRLTHHEAFGTDVQSERDITQRIDEDISARVLVLSVPSCKEIYNVSCCTGLRSCVCARDETLSFVIRSTRRNVLLLKRSISFCLWT